MRPQVGRIIIDQLRRIDFEPYRLWQPPLDAPWSIEKLVNTHLGAAGRATMHGRRIWCSQSVSSIGRSSMISTR